MLYLYFDDEAGEFRRSDKIPADIPKNQIWGPFNSIHEAECKEAEIRGLKKPSLGVEYPNG